MTDTDTWVPLSRRTAGLGPDTTLYEGVPPHLRGVLAGWVQMAFQVLGQRQEPINELQWRLHLPTLVLDELNEERLLDVVDGVLALWPARIMKDIESPWTDGERKPGLTSRLRELLAVGGSTWRVNGTGTALERRVDDTVTAAVAFTERAAAQDAADHLSAAWDSAYGRIPDPDKTYAEAIKAVEAVACALVLPANGNATLGTVRTHLRDAPTKWELVLPGRDGTAGSVTPVVEMLTALWEGQRSRHAGTASSRRQTQAEAEAAVHLAATLVQWLTAGVLRRRTP